MTEYIINTTNMPEHVSEALSIWYEVNDKITRCRDCIYYKPDPNPIDPGWPMMCERTGDDMVEPYGFCAWGERAI